jgi:hypothetical protein
MKKIMVFILALVIVLSAFALSQYDTITDVYADNVKCEDGYDCYWAYHEGQPYQKDQCRHNENSQWKFYIPLRECGEKKEDPTQTPEIVIKLPTKTLQPTNMPQPTETLPPEKEFNPTATQSQNKSKPTNTPTLTPTYVSGENPNQICNWCAMAETQTSAQATQASAQATIASELVGGD